MDCPWMHLLHVPIRNGLLSIESKQWKDRRCRCGRKKLDGKPERSKKERNIRDKQLIVNGSIVVDETDNKKWRTQRGPVVVVYCMIDSIQDIHPRRTGPGTCIMSR